MQDIIIVLPEENFNAGVDFEEDSGVFIHEDGSVPIHNL